MFERERERYWVLVLFQEGCDALHVAVAAFGVGIDKYRLDVDGRIDDVERCLARKIDGDFVWTIDRLAERTNDSLIDSAYFRQCAERYKMRLSCDWRCFGDDGVWISLYIHAGDSDEYLRWPFDRHVTISISNDHRPNVHRSITKRCRIDKPPNDNYRISDAFTFCHSDLSAAGLLLGDRMIVECVVHGE